MYGSSQSAIDNTPVQTSWGKAQALTTAEFWDLISLRLVNSTAEEAELVPAGWVCTLHALCDIHARSHATKPQTLSVLLRRLAEHLNVIQVHL